MNINKEQKDKVEAKIFQSVDILNQQYDLNLKYPDFDFRLKGGVAGVARSGFMDVSFNDYIFYHHFEDALKEVVPHEVAHLGVFQKSKNENRNYPPGHGALWKLMMSTLNVAPKTYHHFEIDKSFIIEKNIKLYEYECLCQNKKPYSEAQYKRIENGVKFGRLFSCVSCGHILIDGKRKLPERLFHE